MMHQIADRFVQVKFESDFLDFVLLLYCWEEMIGLGWDALMKILGFVFFFFCRYYRYIFD